MTPLIPCPEFCQNRKDEQLWNSHLNKMKLLVDDLEVFEILGKAGMENFNPGLTFVCDFLLNGNWHLLLFNPSGKSKGVRLYILEKAFFEMEIEKVLLPELLSLDEHPDYLPLKNEALRIVELFISHRNSSRLFFDAH